MKETKKVKIYTFRTCPYCIKAKELLKKENIPFEEVVVTSDELKDLEKETNHPTVPQIFVDHAFMGGYDDMFELYTKSNVKFNNIFFK